MPNNGVSRNTITLSKERYKQMTVRKYSTYPSNWIGFEELFNSLSYARDNQNSTEPSSFPPYNIINIDANRSIIELAVAGFGPDDIDVEWKDNNLTIRGVIDDKETKKYAVKGIAGRKFTKQFRLGEYIEPIDAGYENGILRIALERVIPEADKPRKVKIGSSKPSFLKE